MEENNVYSVRDIAITFDLTRYVIAADIITPTAGENSGSYFSQGCHLIILYIYIHIYI